VDDPRPTAIVLRVLEQRIADGTYAPGTRIHMQLLSDELGIGVDTIRKALLELASRGLVQRWEGLGWYVTD